VRRSAGNLKYFAEEKCRSFGIDLAHFCEGSSVSAASKLKGENYGEGKK
jgi:hypothetical protein